MMALLMAVMVVAPTVSILAHAADDEEYEDDYDEDESDLQDMLDRLNSKYKKLQEQNNAVQQKINAAASEKQKQVVIKQEIDGQINTTIEQIDTLDERITVLEQRIAEKTREMSAKQKEIDENFSLYQQRLRAMCSLQGTSTLGLMLGVDDFSDMLLRTEVVTAVAQHDTDLINELKEQKAELEAIKKEIEGDKTSVEEDKRETVSKQEELKAQQATAVSRIQDIAAQEQEFLANKAELTKQMQQVQAEISAIIAEINKTSLNTKYIGGGMAWPSASLFQVTCPYGSRFGGSDFHTGIDISGGGAYGSPVLAANSGTVKVANTAVTSGWGYGKYVIIDHGGGIQTLYGHMSALSVSVGDVVAQGQKIGEVGSTGWSTGPHIHFEIRVNNKAVNPQGWSP